MFASNTNTKTNCSQRKLRVSIKTRGTSDYLTLDGAEGPVQLGVGTYTLTGIPRSHPLGILNKGNTRQISYTGDPSKCQTESITNSTANGSYRLYYGTITLTVISEFNPVSLVSSNPRFRGGTYRLQYKEACNQSQVRSSPTSSPARSSRYTAVRLPGPGLAVTQSVTMGTVWRPSTVSNTTTHNGRYQLANSLV